MDRQKVETGVDDLVAALVEKSTQAFPPGLDQFDQDDRMAALDCMLRPLKTPPAPYAGYRA